jgi:hypothetical protein
VDEENWQRMMRQLDCEDTILVKKASWSLIKGDIFALKPYWNTGLPKTVRNILANWEVYRYCLIDELILFTLLLEFKMLRFKTPETSLYQKVYRGVEELHH